MSIEDKKALYRPGSPIDKQIGYNLRYLRECEGVSQSCIAKKLGITFQQYQKYENGNNRLACNRLFRLKHFFKVPYDRFFKDVNPECTGDKTTNETDSATNKEADALTIAIIQKINKLEDKALKSKISMMIDVLTS